MFSKKDIERYYDLSEVHYRLFWNLQKSNSLHYGLWDASTNNFHEALLNTNKTLARMAGISAKDRVLDAGCGVGGSSMWLAKETGCTVTGISLNEKQVARANNWAAAEKMASTLNFLQRDYTDTGLPAASFDVIWAIESVCYAPNKADFLQEAFRLLKPGGRLIVADFFKEEGLRGRDASMVQRWAHGWAIEDYATKNGFISQSSQAGFSNLLAEDVSAAIMPSAKRLYRAYFLGIIPAFVYRVFHRNATALGRNNVDTAFLQYKTLKKRLWQYVIITAVK